MNNSEKLPEYLQKILASLKEKTVTLTMTLQEYHNLDRVIVAYIKDDNPIEQKIKNREHLTCAMSINAYSRQKLENLELYHKEK